MTKRASSAPTVRPLTCRPAGVQVLRLADQLNGRHAKSIALTRQAREHIARPAIHRQLPRALPVQSLPAPTPGVGSFVQGTDGVMLTDLDGVRFYDLTGSYGVNVFGNDFYKACIAEGSERVAELGPLLGSYHPVVASNVEQLSRISGCRCVFHMSGTEAVMQAVRLARYHTRRKYLVRFSGAYHGWWEDVQPGPGNPLPPGKTYTLKEMDADTLRVLRKRRDIACVLVNPLQALHPNRSRRATARWSTADAGTLRPRGLHRVAEATARGVQRARHRTDFR
jgi:glutamate-1-semialdehyde 2,1-aminomutase